MFAIRRRQPLPGNLRREFDSLLERFFEEPWGAAEEAPARWIPLLDVSDNDKEISIRAEIPGVDPGDVDVTVSGNFLTISGHKKESAEQQDENFYRCERRFGSFQRSIELPASADGDKVTAEQQNGVLTIRIPKLAAARSRRIPVKGTDKGAEKVVERKAPQPAMARTGSDR